MHVHAFTSVRLYHFPLPPLPSPPLPSLPLCLYSQFSSVSPMKRNTDPCLSSSSLRAADSSFLMVAPFSSKNSLVQHWRSSVTHTGRRSPFGSIASTHSCVLNCIICGSSKQWYRERKLRNSRLHSHCRTIPRQVQPCSSVNGYDFFSGVISVTYSMVVVHKITIIRALD